MELVSTGSELIEVERLRQPTEEGWDAAHDAGHADELAEAAWCYRYRGDRVRPVGLWPWAERYWKPKDELSNLIRAGALYLAARDASTYPNSTRYAALADAVAKQIDAVQMGWNT
jgi:hypothetical protein